MLEISVLSSGSKGNLTYVASKKTKILVDVGISCKQTVEKLEKINTVPQQINAVILTHEHIDHISGAFAFCNTFNVPLYMHKNNVGVLNKLMPYYCTEFDKFVFDSNDICIGDIDVQIHSLQHDSVHCSGFSFFNGGSCISTLTDLGELRLQTLEHIKASDIVLLECNHDLNMLKQGSYPQWLKKRILSPYGHLSNDQCAFAALDLAAHKTKAIILGHLSMQNNTPQKAYNTVSQFLQKSGVNIGVDFDIYTSDQYKPTEIISTENIKPDSTKL